MLWMPLRVMQGSRSLLGVAVVVEPTVPEEDLRRARSVGGQIRLPPALTERVG